MKEYEASKQLIEVSNEIKSIIITLLPHKKWILLSKDWTIIKGDEPCKAKVIENKATIVELN